MRSRDDVVKVAAGCSVAEGREIAMRMALELNGRLHPALAVFLRTQTSALRHILPFLPRLESFGSFDGPVL